MKIDCLPFFYINIGSNKLILKTNGIDRTNNIKQSDQLYSANNDVQEVNNSLIEIKPLFEIILENGNSISISGDNYLYTEQKGWIKVKDLTKKDYILNKNCYITDNEEKSNGLIGFKNDIKKRNMPVYIPERNSVEFSEWLGIISAYADVNHRYEIIVTLNEDESLYYSKLTKRAINITPSDIINKRINRKNAKIVISQNIYNFIKSFLGPKYGIRKVPSFMINSSLDEQLAFVKGLSLKAKIEKKCIIIYQGTSKPITDFASLVLMQAGYQISVQTKKMPNGKFLYILRINGVYKNCRRINFLNKELNFIYSKYSSEMIMTFSGKRRYNKITYKPKAFYYYCKIREVRNLGEKESVSIKLQNTNGMTYNNVVVSGSI